MSVLYFRGISIFVVFFQAERVPRNNSTLIHLCLIFLFFNDIPMLYFLELRFSKAFFKSKYGPRLLWSL